MLSPFFEMIGSALSEGNGVKAAMITFVLITPVALLTRGLAGDAEVAGVSARAGDEAVVGLMGALIDGAGRATARQ